MANRHPVHESIRNIVYQPHVWWIREDISTLRNAKTKPIGWGFEETLRVPSSLPCRSRQSSSNDQLAPILHGSWYGWSFASSWYFEVFKTIQICCKYMKTMIILKFIINQKIKDNKCKFYIAYSLKTIPIGDFGNQRTSNAKRLKRNEF